MGLVERCERELMNAMHLRALANAGERDTAPSVRDMAVQVAAVADDHYAGLDALARDAVSLAEHLLGYAPRHERAQHYQALTDLRASINREMKRAL